MSYINIGKIVNTHALKGETKIISNFEFKSKIFKIKNSLFVGEAKEELIIESYRKHKNYDMVKFLGIDNINDVLKYKGEFVYYIRESLNLNSDEYLDKDLIGLEVFYNNKSIGHIDDIELNAKNKLFVINDKLIPYNANFIEKINIEDNKILLKNLEGLI